MNKNHDQFPNRRRSERTLMAFTECCNVLLNSSSEPELLESICRIVCETGGYMMAWVGYAEDDEYKTVKPMAYSGYEEGYLTNIDISWGDNEHGHGPTGTAIRKNEIVVNRDFASNTDSRPWVKEAVKRRYSSAIAIPLTIEEYNRPLGTLTIYSSQTDAFDNYEVQLLKVLANYLAHGILSIRRNSAKLVSEKALRDSEERFRKLIENAIVGKCVTEGAKISYVNSKFAQIFGYDRDEILNYDLFHLLAEERSTLELLFAGLAAGDIEEFHIEIKGVKKDGSLIDIELEMSTLQYAHSRVLTGTVIDITQRKKAETDLKRSKEDYRMLSARIQSFMEEERGRISREIHDELGQALTALKMDLISIKKAVFEEKSRGDLLDLLKRTQDMSGLIEGTIGKVRRIAHELRPAILDDFGIVEAIKSHLLEFQMRTEIACDLSSEVKYLALDKERSTAVFRIFQEALTNSARHSGANKISVSVDRVGEKMFLEVKDNGIGIYESRIRGICLGILGMKERANQFGGTVEITGKRGEGTVVRLFMPINVDDPACDV